LLHCSSGLYAAEHLAKSFVPVPPIDLEQVPYNLPDSPPSPNADAMGEAAARGFSFIGCSE
jgi:hypothetical protein